MEDAIDSVINTRGKECVGFAWRYMFSVQRWAVPLYAVTCTDTVDQYIIFAPKIPMDNTETVQLGFCVNNRQELQPYTESVLPVPGTFECVSS